MGQMQLRQQIFLKPKKKFRTKKLQNLLMTGQMDVQLTTHIRFNSKCLIKVEVHI